MSQTESSVGSSAGAAPPSAPSTAATPPSATPQPAAAPVAPATPAATSPAAPPSDAAAPSTTPGAQPSKPTSLDAAHELYRQEKARIAAAEGAQSEAPPAATPVEAPVTPEPAPVEVQPAEPVVEPPAEVAPPAEAAPVEEPPAVVGDETDYREAALTAEDLAKRFPRVPKSTIAEIVKMETHRGELLEERNAIGGDIGAQISRVINPIILGVEDPTDADVDTIFDQLTLPENAHAVALFDKMGKRLVNLQLQDETCGSCHGDGREANPECSSHIAAGREFGSNMIAEEYGKNEDGTAFDFWGMKPIEFVDTLVKAAKQQDEDGNHLIVKEFIQNELAANKKPEPTPEMLALQRENEELRNSTKAEREANATEQTRKDEERKVAYKTQATGYVSRQLNAVILPLATKANWIAVEGETGEQAEQRMHWGRMLTNDIETSVLGRANKPTVEYQAVLDMIENNTAFDAQGHPTPRFGLKLKPLQTKAKAEFVKAERLMGKLFKFAANTSRAAQLVKEVGGKVGDPAEEAPPLAVTPPPADPNRKKSSAELLEEERVRYRAAAAAAAQRQTAGVVR